MKRRNFLGFLGTLPLLGCATVKQPNTFDKAIDTAFDDKTGRWYQKYYYAGDFRITMFSSDKLPYKVRKGKLIIWMPDRRHEFLENPNSDTCFYMNTYFKNGNITKDYAQGLCGYGDVLNNSDDIVFWVERKSHAKA